MIFILTGNVRTGKTTALLNWSKNRSDVVGVLCPDDAFGKRYFLEVKSKATFPLEIDSTSDEESITVGTFLFLKSAFKKANGCVLDSAKNQNYSYIIIDELGKLELQNEGLHESAKTLIPNVMFNHHQHLILVVRSALLEGILKHYHILNYKLVSKEDLTEKSFT